METSEMETCHLLEVHHYFPFARITLDTGTQRLNHLEGFLVLRIHITKYEHLGYGVNGLNIESQKVSIFGTQGCVPAHPFQIDQQTISPS